jgi:succinate dehydrogenase/fumarate reductase flavoprotein subunit
MSENNMDRRDFLKGVGLVGAGVVGAGALAACSPGTSTSDGSNGAGGASGPAGGSATTASDLAVSPAGANYPWPANPPEIADADVKTEIDCDVVVIGLGVAGCAAFRAAAEAGAKTVAFEKASMPCCRSSQYAYVNGPHSEAWGLMAWPTDAELRQMIENEVRDMNYMAKYDIWLRWARESAEVFEWYCKGVPNFDFPETAADFAAMSMEAPAANAEPAPPTVAGMPSSPADYTEDRNAYPVTMNFSDHQAMLDGQVTTATELGAEAYFGHFAEKLIVEGGKVVGVYARNADTGKYVKANASKGVILTCGDLHSNEDMVRFFLPELIENGNANVWPNFDVEGNRTNTGDGFKLGYWAGAAIQEHMASMNHVMGGKGGPEDTHAASMGVMGCAPYLRLNKLGERFMNEDISNVNAEYPTDEQPDRKWYMFFDSKYPDYPELAGLFPTDEATIEAAIVDGKCFKGNTVEELLDQLETDKEAALASIKRYNELVAKGEDEDFNKLPKYLKPLETGPFYAQFTGTALCLTTMGGLVSDKEAHVLGNDRKIIPGLYAGGNIQGSRFAVKYPFKLGGASHCMAMFYGYVAGKNAAKGV